MACFLFIPVAGWTRRNSTQRGGTRFPGLRRESEIGDLSVPFIDLNTHPRLPYGCIQHPRPNVSRSRRLCMKDAFSILLQTSLSLSFPLSQCLDMGDSQDPPPNSQSLALISSAWKIRIRISIQNKSLPRNPGAPSGTLLAQTSKIIPRPLKPSQIRPEGP